MGTKDTMKEFGGLFWVTLVLGFIFPPVWIATAFFAAGLYEGTLQMKEDEIFEIVVDFIKSGTATLHLPKWKFKEISKYTKVDTTVGIQCRYFPLDKTNNIKVQVYKDPFSKGIYLSILKENEARDFINSLHNRLFGRRLLIITAVVVIVSIVIAITNQ